MPTVQQVTNILGEFYFRNMEDSNWEEFFSANNIAFPVAYLSWRGLVIPTQDSAEYLNETWTELCQTFEVDPSQDYDSLDEFLT